MNRHGYMKIRGTADESVYVEIDYVHELDANEVVDFIKGYATDKDLNMINNAMSTTDAQYMSKVTLFDVMKNNLLVEAMNKYSLQEIEEILKL